MKNWFLKKYYTYYHFEAFIMNDSMGDDFGCSYIYSGQDKVPFYIKNHFSFIKKNIENKLIQNKEISNIITLDLIKDE